MTLIWPSPPLWLTMPTLPAGARGPMIAAVDVIANASTKLMTPLQLGPMMRMPGAPRERDEPRLALAALRRSGLGEAGAVDGHEGHADRGAIGEHVEHALGRDDDADVVGRFGQVLDARVAGEPGQLFQPRIDRIDLPRVAEVGHLAEHAPAERSRMVGGADQCDRPRREQARKIGFDSASAT